MDVRHRRSMLRCSWFPKSAFLLYPDSAGIRVPLLPSGAGTTLLGGMIRPGFLDPESRRDLIDLARDGSAAHRLARRANALVLLDDGMSCEAVARVLLLDDDTIRTWHRLYQEDGLEGLAGFGYEGGACRLNDEQQEKLKAWVAALDARGWRLDRERVRHHLRDPIRADRAIAPARAGVSQAEGGVAQARPGTASRLGVRQRLQSPGECGSLARISARSRSRRCRCRRRSEPAAEGRRPVGSSASAATCSSGGSPGSSPSLR